MYTRRTFPDTQTKPRSPYRIHVCIDATEVSVFQRQQLYAGNIIVIYVFAAPSHEQIDRRNPGSNYIFWKMPMRAAVIVELGCI